MRTREGKIRNQNKAILGGEGIDKEKLCFIKSYIPQLEQQLMDFLSSDVIKSKKKGL